MTHHVCLKRFCNYVDGDVVRMARIVVLYKGNGPPTIGLLLFHISSVFICCFRVRYNWKKNQ